jgi:hypothetical protein
MRWELESGGANRCLYAIATLAHARIGQTDHPKERQSKPDVDFDVNRVGLDAKNRGTLQSRKHGVLECKRAASRVMALSC